MDVRKEMELKSVREDKDKIIVITIGAKYIIDKSKKRGKISCYQVLNKERLLAEVEFNYSFSTITMEHKDRDTAIFHIDVGDTDYLRLQINSDSLLDIFGKGNIYHYREFNLSFLGNFFPDYSVEKMGNILLIDEIGGIGLYPYEGLKNMEFSNFTRKEWKVDYTMERYSRFLISVFPPRKFNYDQYYNERIVHHDLNLKYPSPFPSDEMIEEARKYASILVLHDSIWQGKYTRRNKPVKTLKDRIADAAYCSFEYIPLNEKELRRVIKKAHSLKMKVIPYMSPYFSMAQGKDFINKVEEKIKEYNFDGVYYDGIPMDTFYSYQLIRETRALLKDKIFYLHCTKDPLKSLNIYCPFIDTYADFTLRAESYENFRDDYLRYVISGFNISNSIGHICYYTYPLSFIRKLIPKALKMKVRFYLGSPETERERILKKEYFPKLKR